MAPDEKRTSPSKQSGGDDADDGARDLYYELTEDLLYDPAIGRATMMGYPCVRLAGQFLASYDDKAGCLVVKLPRERVTELVEVGQGDPFAPAGKVFREWVSIPTADPELWQALLAEAVDFARLGLSACCRLDVGRRPAPAPDGDAARFGDLVVPIWTRRAGGRTKVSRRESTLTPKELDHDSTRDHAGGNDHGAGDTQHDRGVGPRVLQRKP
jgi:hypothetical protein